MIRLFDDNKGKVSAQLLDIGACKEGTAEALFNNIGSTLRENKSDWENCVAVGIDNTAVNLGKKFHHDTGIGKEQKYVYKYLSLTHNPQHCKQRSGMSVFDVENFLVDLFHWFDKSFKRKFTPNFQL